MATFITLISFLLCLLPFGLTWDGGGDGGGGGGSENNNPNPGGGGSEAKYTDADLNRILAQDRKRNETAAAREKSALEQKLAAILKGDDLPEDSPLRLKFDELHNSVLTTEERSKKEAAKHANELKSATERANAAETKYRTTTIMRQLFDAAIGKASGNDPSATARIIADQLFKSSKLEEKNGAESVLVEIEVTENNVTDKKWVTPAEAVAAMEKKVDQYGTLFKSFAPKGPGDKGNAPKDGQGNVDWGKMDIAQFRDTIKNHPELIG